MEPPNNGGLLGLQKREYLATICAFQKVVVWKANWNSRFSFELLYRGTTYKHRTFGPPNIHAESPCYGDSLFLILRSICLLFPFFFLSELAVGSSGFITERRRNCPFF